jgi:hypothetical protein
MSLHRGRPGAPTPPGVAGALLAAATIGAAQAPRSPTSR